MPRKIRQLMTDLQRAGFVALPRRGKGSHSVWKHPAYPEIPAVTLAGTPGDDAKPYQEQDVRNVLAQVKGRERHHEDER
ncbi:MAG: type II toxin-antitoxin system HicA family toxin [Sulfobacillus acidophilus]|uniref:Type II toxin-antitoxin system HicA family toxin n=1 Tax=Sulfobacillus acidophilus TaxID=53633 RepID=A0A2T2WLY3_9FIRM|nr:MAG: type II toxin-antitoxin system HicA family toxin [Sulfobacillus acidophilus]